MHEMLSSLESCSRQKAMGEEDACCKGRPDLLMISPSCLGNPKQGLWGMAFWSVHTSLAYERSGFQFVHARGEQWSQGALTRLTNKWKITILVWEFDYQST